MNFKLTSELKLIKNTAKQFAEKMKIKREYKIRNINYMQN